MGETEDKTSTKTPAAESAASAAEAKPASQATEAKPAGSEPAETKPAVQTPQGRPVGQGGQGRPAGQGGQARPAGQGRPAGPGGDRRPGGGGGRPGQRDGRPRGGGGGGGGKRFFRRRKVDYFSANKIDDVNYKDVNTLRQFIGDRGKILPRRHTGLSAQHQRLVKRAIKRARNIALLPFAGDG
jgi:small subunit ribosomal protein S18